MEDSNKKENVSVKDEVKTTPANVQQEKNETKADNTNKANVKQKDDSNNKSVNNHTNGNGQKDDEDVDKYVNDTPSVSVDKQPEAVNQSVTNNEANVAHKVQTSANLTQNFQPPEQQPYVPSGKGEQPNSMQEALNNKRMKNFSSELDPDALVEANVKDKKEHGLVKSQAKDAAGFSWNMLVLTILLGNPMLALVGVLAVRNNDLVQSVAKCVNYKPMFIPAPPVKEK